MALPASIAQGAVVSSGCIGNRIYTDLGDGEMYAVLRAIDLARIADEVETVTGANTQLSQYHAARRQTLASA